jgi:hypothetical protein
VRGKGSRADREGAAGADRQPTFSAYRTPGFLDALPVPINGYIFSPKWNF